MTPFTKHEGILVPYVHANVDTDQIIPARYLHRGRAEGFADQLFHDLRFDDTGAGRPGFVLHKPSFRNGTILVGGPNFGCGSSREHAVWALVDHGFRAVIAEGFGDIFANNAVKNGLLPVVASRAHIDALADAAQERPGATARVDLREQRVEAGAVTFRFEIGPYSKGMLLEGASEVEMTLKTALAEIEAYEAAHRPRCP